MGRQLTQEEAITACIIAHNGFYTYENAIYRKATEKMSVTCPLHGDFMVTLSNHTHTGKSRGCPVCGDLSRAAKKTLPASAFLRKAQESHGTLYDYSKVDYKNTFTKVEISCKEHGSFWQAPEKHIAGRGCPVCAGKGIMSADRFKNTAYKRHGDKYDYSLITDDSFYEAAVKVPIICSVHGEFLQQFDNHLQGQGCRKCAKYGFNSGKRGILYVLQEGNRVKVGITNREMHVRLKEINKPTGCFSVIQTYEYLDGLLCAKHETELLRLLRSLYKNTKGTFDGVTESFEDVDIKIVLSYIGELRECLRKY